MSSTTDRTDAEAIAANYRETRSADSAPDSYTCVSTDAMSAAAGYVSREYGDYGYTIGIVGAQSGHGVFVAHHYDGSRFWFAADKWGNVAPIDF